MSNDELVSMMSVSVCDSHPNAVGTTASTLFDSLRSASGELSMPLVPLGMPLEAFQQLLAERNNYLRALDERAMQPAQQQLAIQVKPSPLGKLRKTLRQLCGK